MPRPPAMAPRQLAIVPLTKRCTRCKRDLPLSEFYAHPTGRHGVGPTCKPCHKDVAGARYAASPKDQVRAGRRRYKYGLEPGAYDSLVAAQGGRCAICQREPKPGKVLAVDHHHATRKVRGLLCSACNTALGLLDEDPSRAIALIAYLETHR